MPERLIDKKSNMVNYTLSKRRINSGMDPGIESDPAPSAVSGSITIGGEAGAEIIFRRETERSETWHMVGQGETVAAGGAGGGHYRNLSL